MFSSNTNISRDRKQISRNIQTSESPTQAKTKDGIISDTVKNAMQSALERSRNPNNGKETLTSALNDLNKPIKELSTKLKGLDSSDKTIKENPDINALKEHAIKLTVGFSEIQRVNPNHVKNVIKKIMETALKLDNEIDHTADSETEEIGVTERGIKEDIVKAVLKKLDDIAMQKLDDDYEEQKASGFKVSVSSEHPKLYFLVKRAIVELNPKGNESVSVATGPNSIGGNELSEMSDDELFELSEVNSKESSTGIMLEEMSDDELFGSSEDITDSPAQIQSDHQNETSDILSDLDDTLLKSAENLNKEIKEKKESINTTSLKITPTPTQATAQAPSKSSPANASELPTAIVESGVEDSTQANVGGGVDAKVEAEMASLLTEAKAKGLMKLTEAEVISDNLNSNEASKENISNHELAQFRLNLDSSAYMDKVGKTYETMDINTTQPSERHKASNVVLREARIKYLNYINSLNKNESLKEHEAKYLEKLLRDIDIAESERNKCAKLASLTDEEINLDLKEDKEFKIEMQKFFKTKMGQEALSMFEPEFVDRVTNMYLGGLSLKIVFTELFSKYLKEQNSHQRTGDILDKYNDIVKKQDESKESLDLLTKLLKELNEVQKDDFNLFQDFKILSGKNKTTILTHNYANRILKSLICNAVKEISLGLE